MHVDTSYTDDPPAYTALRAVAERGGQVLFTDRYAAYDTLPAGLRTRLDGRTVRHVVTGVDPGQQTSAEHPVFARHSAPAAPRCTSRPPPGAQPSAASATVLHGGVVTETVPPTHDRRST